MARLSLLLLAALVGLGDAAVRSNKRGLVFTPNADFPEDNKIWRQTGSDLTWYYNYGSRPSPFFANVPQKDFEFVPMMWGIGSNPNETKWLDEVKEVIKGGVNITHALGFNEPDGKREWGSSDITPRNAAIAWIHNFEPLAAMGIKLGLPACTGAPAGLTWTKQFLANCSEIISEGASEKKNCTWHFLPVHWYDNFGGLKSHIEERRTNFPGAEIWVTEYAYAHQDLKPTQDFYNQSAEYLDKQSWLGRYSYFGAFRSQKSNVGPNAPFLNSAGKLTDIGSWYLGVQSTPSKGTHNAKAAPVAAAGAVAAAGVVLAGLL